MNVNALVCTSVASLALLGAALVVAGPLNPPAGAVVPTYKTLTEIEPRTPISPENTPGDVDSVFRITQPGAYYLAANVTGAAAKHGIEIAAAGVTIDLGGFELQGVPGSLDAISNTIGGTNLHIRNGSIRDWGDEGVDCTTTEMVCVSDVRVRNCVGIGISVGRYSTVSRCSAASNSAGGIFTSFNCVVRDCNVQLNGSGGIFVGAHSRVVDCVASNNPGNGITVGVGAAISGCAASASGLTGFALANGCTIVNSSASGNTGSGITAGDGCTVTSCTSSGNSSHGIAAFNTSVISACSTAGNILDGIVVGTKCLVTGNQCGSTSLPGTSATGIHVTGFDNRIEGNLLAGNARGLDVDGAGNVIIRNVASGNTVNWDVVAGNFGQFSVATSGGAVAGNTGGAALGSSDPWVNFTY